MPVVGCSCLVASVTEQLGDRHHKVFIVVYDEHVRGCLLSPFYGAAPHGTRRGAVQEASSVLPRASLRTVGVELVRSSMLPRRRGASGLNRRSTIPREVRPLYR